MSILNDRTYFCARFGNCTKVVDHVCLGHTDTRVTDAENLVLLVGSDTDVEVFLGVELGRIGQRCITDLIEGVGTVGDQLPQENLLVRVEGICDRKLSVTQVKSWKTRARTDDQVQKLRDLSLESEAFSGHYESVGVILNGEIYKGLGIRQTFGRDAKKGDEWTSVEGEKKARRWTLCIPEISSRRIRNLPISVAVADGCGNF
ncbi:hypothetical protein BDN70DRAFT_112524 [Pholiota conissans]|uniref:Uncharacterized protein n=1 Tax=Pholiota conissans TaxID=109636 RepID=A0A9P6CYJ2_9AGAR|nr:hypothetical protein BDN70DRAFT_112524 [Pholiota conissans]